MCSVKKKNVRENKDSHIVISRTPATWLLWEMMIWNAQQVPEKCHTSKKKKKHTMLSALSFLLLTLVFPEHPLLLWHQILFLLFSTWNILLIAMWAKAQGEVQLFYYRKYTLFLNVSRYLCAFCLQVHSFSVMCISCCLSVWLVLYLSVICTSPAVVSL